MTTCEVCGRPCLEIDTAFCSDRCTGAWQDAADAAFTALLEAARDLEARKVADKAALTGLWN